jgi:hypothetical protein
MSDIEDMMMHIKVFVFDVREKEGKYSLLYCTNDAVMIDTQHKAGGEYVSLKVCARTMFKTYLCGRIIWMSDLFAAAEYEDMGKKNVELWRINEASVTRVAADGIGQIVTKNTGDTFVVK